MHERCLRFFRRMLKMTVTYISSIESRYFMEFLASSRKNVSTDLYIFFPFTQMIGISVRFGSAESFFWV